MATISRAGSESLPPTATSSGNSPPASAPSSNPLQLSLEERLAAILNSDQFTIASYLNLALAERKDSGGGNDQDDQQALSSSHSTNNDELQQRMAQLALQLQLQTQSCHEEIGRIGAELQAILPRCSADIGRVGVSLDGLRMDAVSLLESTLTDTGEEEQHVSSSLETLSTLHALQANLQRTKEILTAAATWDSTLSSVAPLLAAQNLPEAVNALAQLENGERALRGMPNPEERTAAITKVRQQVSVLLQPQLKHALANMNTRLAPLQQCVLLYSKLNRMDALKEEYVKNRPSAIHKAWFDYKPVYERQQQQGAVETTGPDAAVAAAQFLDWLPGWFDAVLSLVTEERRQSGTIFGPEMVPVIVVEVFRECFRPILASFQSRLESIHSSDASRSSKNTSKGSLESICAIYESTLRFLSLAYEAIANGWIDMVESGVIDPSGSTSLYNDISAIFLQVTAPFVAYQQRLSQLEGDYLGGQTRAIAYDVQKAVTAVSASDLPSLQGAIEKLQELSTFAFPLSEGAVARFELMNGGYGPAKALSAIDRVLSGHAGELAMAIKTLSAAMMADQVQLANNMDEPHVLCALEVLKVAGSFRRGLRALEDKTRERLVVLSERMEAHAKREKAVQEASNNKDKNLPKSRSSAFTLPDSLSAAEIDSLVTKSVCGSDSDGEMGGSQAVLQRLTAASGDAATSLALLREAEEATRRLSSSCHAFVFDICSSVPRLHLGGVSSMPVWQKGTEAAGADSYGTLPQNYITQVGEHMLSLVQALEPFASDQEALALANEVMGNVREIALGPWREFASASGSPSLPDDVVKDLMEGKKLIGLVLGNPPIDDDVDETEEDDQDEAARASTAFCDIWLDVVGLAVTGRLLERIMLIPSVSPKGCEHLTADLNYLVNVLSALGITGHPHPLLGHIAEVSAMDSDSLVQQISTRDPADALSSSLATMEKRLASLRGIPTVGL